MSEDSVDVSDCADVHNQGSAVTSDAVKMHKGPWEGHAHCSAFEKNTTLILYILLSEKVLNRVSFYKPFSK